MIVPLEFLWLVFAIPIVYLYLIQFTKNPKKYRRAVFYILLLEYIVLLICFAVVFRGDNENYSIQRHFFWSYTHNTEDMARDNLINISVFVPVGILTSIVSRRFAVVKSLLLGLLISETIECCQIIFQRGTFDVDDIINNTVGALIGSIVWITLTLLGYIVKQRQGCLDNP